MRTKVIIPRDGEMRLNVRTMAHTGNPRADAGWGDRAADSWLYVGGGVADQRRSSLRASALAERGTYAELVDRPVRVEIAMREAELFAIRLECDLYNACEPLGSLW